MTHEVVPTDPNIVPHIEALVDANPEIAGLRVYEYFRSDINDQKADFIAGSTDQLQPHYSNLNSDSVMDLKLPMEQAIDELRRPTTDPKAEALFDAVEFRYGELFLMDMARVMNDQSATEAERAEARDWFQLASENLYGAPDREVFSGLARKNLLARTEAHESDDAPTANLRQELRALIGNIDPSDFAPTVPDAETIQRIHDLLHERFDELVDHIDDTEYDVDTMVVAFQTMLDKLGATKLGWRAERTAQSNSLGVAAHQRLVEIGENKKSLQGSALKALGVHEVGVHVLRSLRAERAGWLAAAYGMNGYTNFEEPTATALQAAWTGAFNGTGEAYQVIAGLAYGYDNHEPRNFSEVYDIMWRANALKDSALPVTDESITAAKSAAVISCVRMFRGTDFETPGIVYLKDLSYFGGQETAWNMLADVQTQEDLDFILSGKVDLTRDDHRAIARAIVSELQD